MSENEKICVKCNKSVEKNQEQYEVFEKMHWLCFHLEYEHEGDPDRPCNDPDCPWMQIEIFQNKLKALGFEPQDVFEQAIEERWK